MPLPTCTKQAPADSVVVVVLHYMMEQAMNDHSYYTAWLYILAGTGVQKSELLHLAGKTMETSRCFSSAEAREIGRLQSNA